MPIRLRCEHCGAAMTAPRDMAGRMAKCPACGNTLYVPTPEEEIEELPLAPEDPSVLRNEAALQAERRRLESLLAREAASPDSAADEPARSGPAAPGGAGTARPGLTGSGGVRLDRALSNYLSAMRNSDLEAADKALAVLRLQPRTARDLIDRLAADQIPPPEMAGVPAGVYQGYLKALRSKLG